MSSSIETTSPFSEGHDDERLVSDAVAGDRGALETLVQRHQPWIYNLAFRMVMVHDDAEDVTQEVLIKVITKLASYDSTRGAFRTWLYRIVANHVITMQSRGYESAITDADAYYSFVTQVSNEEADDSPETQLVIHDLSIGCVMGILLCLNRTDRLVFLLAVGFDVTDVVGGEIMGLSREAFRKRLSRARARVRRFMAGNCGLVDPNAPCRCRHKAQAFVSSGQYASDRLSFHRPDNPKLMDLVGEVMNGYGTEVNDEFVRLFRDHPFYSAPDIAPWLRELIAKPQFREIWQLDENEVVT